LSITRRTVAVEACGQQRVGGIELLFVALVAQAHHHVWVPVTALDDEMATHVEGDAVLAPVEVLVPIGVGVLVVQLGVDRPQRVDELADADGAERGVTRAALVVLDVHAHRTGEVPAVIEFLRAGGTGHAQATDQGGTEEYLVQVCLLECNEGPDTACAWFANRGDGRLVDAIAAEVRFAPVKAVLTTA